MDPPLLTAKAPDRLIPLQWQHECEEATRRMCRRPQPSVLGHAPAIREFREWSAQGERRTVVTGGIKDLASDKLWLYRQNPGSQIRRRSRTKPGSSGSPEMHSSPVRRWTGSPGRYTKT